MCDDQGCRWCADGPTSEQDPMPFEGETYSPQQDQKRLKGQLKRVFDAMADGQWWTLETLHTQCGGSQAGISARIRDLRKPKCGSLTVDRERLTGGLWRYRLKR